jgi:hypothetical protein
MKYTKKQIKVMRARLQEYVDIGWNAGVEPLQVCPFCNLFGPKPGSGCGYCPVYGGWGCNDFTPMARRELIMAAGTRYEEAHREAAREHAHWMVRCFNVADEGGEWSIE